MFDNPVIREITDILDAHQMGTKNARSICTCMWVPDPNQLLSAQFRVHQTTMLADWYLARVFVST